jgi:DNA transposition AAA+ family ATPase
MPSDSRETILTPEEVAAIREEAEAIMAADGISRKMLGGQAGVSYPTISAWLTGKYAGDNAGIALKVRVWLRAHLERRKARETLPPGPGFVMTRTAERIMGVLTYAQQAPDISVVTGPPGIGKTSAACAYVKRAPRAYKITAHPGLSSPRAALEEIGRTIGAIDERALHKMQRTVCDRLRGTQALLIFDEAQHLTSPALDQIRSLHDEARVGVALLGNSAVVGRLEGTGHRKAEFAQLFSRVGMRLTSERDHAARLRDDVGALLDGHDISEDRLRRRLLTAARQAGALRSMTKVLTLARMLALGAGEELAIGHVDMAWEQLKETKLQGEAA